MGVRGHNAVGSLIEVYAPHVRTLLSGVWLFNLTIDCSGARGTVSGVSMSCFLFSVCRLSVFLSCRAGHGFEDARDRLVFRGVMHRVRRLPYLLWPLSSLFSLFNISFVCRQPLKLCDVRASHHPIRVRFSRSSFAGYQLRSLFFCISVSITSCIYYLSRRSVHITRTFRTRR